MSRQPHPRGELVEGVMPWIHSRANKLAGTFGDPAYDQDDLAQDAALAALERPTGHDPERGAPSTWAAFIVKSVAAGKHKRARTASRDLRRNRSMSNEDATDAYGIAEDDGPDDHDPEALAGIIRGVRIAMLQLPRDELSVVELHFGMGPDGECASLPPTEIAKRLGIALHEVNKLLNRGLDKLYKLLSDPPPKRMTPNELLMSVHRWLYKLAWRWRERAPQHYTPDDLAQEFAVRILAKADRYDPAKGHPVNWAFKVCRSVLAKIWQSYRALCRRSDVVSLDGTAEKSLLPTLGSRRDDPASVVEAADVKCFRKECLAAMLECLPPRQQFVLEAMSGLGDGHEYDAGEVAEVLGVGRSHLYKLRRQALESLGMTEGAAA